MKKRLVSIILTAFLVLSMMPFAVFADNAIVCPACGGSVTKQERRLLTAHDDFYKCDKCGKWAWANKLGSLSLFSVGDQQILDAADSSAFINFSFNNGKLIPAEKAPSGIGRKDLPGYADDNGTPSVSSDGGIIWQPTWDDVLDCNFFLQFTSREYGYGTEYNLQEMKNGSYNTSTSTYNKSFVFSGTQLTVSWNYTSYSYASNGVFSATSGDKGVFKFKTPIRGYYSRLKTPRLYFKAGNETLYYLADTKSTLYDADSIFSYNSMLGAGSFKNEVSSSHHVWQFYMPQYKIIPFDSADKPTSSTNITINNNTWNGNIYTDNSTNLTYIYPQYTTINEKNETVTNISTNPIIYNNETKQYYTYDTVTNNYYYITYETSPTPTPSPSPAPAPTWTPGGGATRGGGVGRHPSDTDAADWTLHYYILNNRRYDAYYALKKTEVDTETKLPWVDNKKYISTTQIPIANGQYTVSVPDGVYWRVWSWDEASQTLTGVNSSNWHSTINNFLFNATGEYIFEFCKADGSNFDTAKDVTLKLKNDKITDYEDGGTIVEEPTPSPSPEPTETPSPTEPPTPTATPNPGGGTVPTPGGGTSGGNSGNGSNISGGDDEGLFGWLWDLLKDLVKAILKAIFKVLSGILGFLIWLVERVGLLFPFLPAPAVAALGAGVVLVFVIKIIRFIRG